jgi:phosphate transport system substrate-binding protein
MRRMGRTATCIALIAVALLAPGTAAAAEPVRIGGTGSATAMMGYLGNKFAAAHEARFEVIPSLGSTGGLRALEAGVLDIAVSGRKLSAAEIAKGLTERAAVRSPWGLATSQSHPGPMHSASVAALYADEQARWPDGTPIRIILRPKSDSENHALAEFFPGMAAALERLRARRDLPIAATDQDSADMAERVSGSLVSITFTQLTMERRNLRLLAIDGVEPTFESFVSGHYRFGKTVYLVTRVEASPAALRFIAFLNSAEGRHALRETGNLPVPHLPVPHLPVPR